MYIPKIKAQVPCITTVQMIEVDRLMMEVYHIELIQMMENAGRCLAILAHTLFPQSLTAQKITVLASTGGNGGGALVAARRLAAWGADVHVRISNTESMKTVTAHQYQILKKMGVDAKKWSDADNDELESSSLILDGILGYSLSGAPRGTVRSMMAWAIQHKAPKIALDTPSGIDLTESKVHEPVIKAEATLTLALPKTAFLEAHVKGYLGQLYLADISVPPKLYAEPSLQLKVPETIFEGNDIVQIF